MGPDDAVAAVLDAVRDEEHFVSASVTGARRGRTPPARRVGLRPVELRSGRHVQVSTFDGTRTDVRNVAPEEIAGELGRLLDEGYGSVHVKTLVGDLQLSFTKKGKPRLVRHAPSVGAIDDEHDRTKQHRVGGDAPFLREAGITDGDGRIKPSARHKHRQVERFVELLAHTLDASPLADARRVVAVDLGCGSGVLTLATYHELAVRRGLDVTMIGVDTKAELMQRLTATARRLDWDGLRFTTGRIDEFVPDEVPDLVLALHACDTATDDALARAVGWGSTVVLAAPCCQHDLQTQLDVDAAPALAASLLRDGIVRERLGDLLTDTFRADLLRASGYRTDVVEFVDTEHTPKNVMIRATLEGSPDHQRLTEVDELAAGWGVTPALRPRLPWPAPPDRPAPSPTSPR